MTLRTDSLPVRALFALAAAAVLWPAVSAGAALVLGIAFAVLLGNPFAAQTKKATHRLLQASVVGLGFGMDLRGVANAGLHGIGYTVVGITGALVAGTLLARLLRVERHAGLLITVGTAICGGSAIAAAAPVLRAKDHDVSVALGTVFMLNAVALVLFPPLGHALMLAPERFGLFAALAIHDTSSVVGAAMAYGGKALEVATSVKLARALWIVPVTLALGWIESRRGTGAAQGKAAKPWFILGFVAAAALVSFVPAVHPAGAVVAKVAQRALVLTLFLVGAGLSREAIRQVGARPLVFGVILWLCVGGATLGALELGLLR